MNKTILQIFTAILVLGLFCGVVAAAPSIITTDPATNSTISSIVGDILTFSVQTNESTTIDWLVNGATDNNNKSFFTETNTSRLNHTVQSGSYDIKATVVSTGESRTWSVIGGTGNNKPVITLSDPSSSSVSNNIGESRTFTANLSQISTIKWFLDDTFLKTDESVSGSSYTISATQGTHTIKVEAQNENGTAESNWTWTVNSQSANNLSGNRIWEDGMATTYTWDAQSFSGFYYDLDSGVSSEEMIIKNIGRSINSGDLEYVTKPVITTFQHSDWGSYQVVGFMAEKYFAGYSKENSTIISEDISPLSDGILSQILLDNDDKSSFSSGQSLALDEGYSLSIKEVDVNGNSVLVDLEKDGKVVDESVVSSGGDYIYKKSLGTVSNVPTIIVHFGTVFTGAESSAVMIQGTFQISDNYVQLKNDETFGQMKVMSYSSDEIDMQNPNNIGLDEGSTFDLMGNIQIQVANSNTLRFAPTVNSSEAGIELRGTVYDQNINGNNLPTWTPYNFEGFYYNMDQGIGTEKLAIEELNGRTIPENKLVYQSSPIQIAFQHTNWGNYTVLGFNGNEYFAGYP